MLLAYGSWITLTISRLWLKVKRLVQEPYIRIAMAEQTKKESPLKKRREELGLTQRDIAFAIDSSVQTISNWETGRYKDAKLTLPQIKALCRVLQWTVEDLPDDFAPSEE